MQQTQQALNFIKKWLILIVLAVVVVICTIIIPLVDWTGENGLLAIQLETQLQIEEAILNYGNYYKIINDCSYLIFDSKSLGDWFSYSMTHLRTEQLLITIITEILALSIFISFSVQGQINSREFPERVEAEKLLGKFKIKDYKPISPTKFKARKYSIKTICIIISTFISMYLFAKILIDFDAGTFLGITTSCTTAILFGIITMKEFEDYYKFEFIKWAKWKVEMLEKEDNTKCHNIEMER